MSGTLRGDVWKRRIRYSPSELGAVLLNRATQTPYRYVIAGLVLLCYFSGGLNFAVVTPLFKLIIAEYGITHAIVSLLVSLVSLINASVGLPGGIIRWALGSSADFAVQLALDRTIGAFAPCSQLLGVYWR